MRAHLKRSQALFRRAAVGAAAAAWEHTPSLLTGGPQTDGPDPGSLRLGTDHWAPSLTGRALTRKTLGRRWDAGRGSYVLSHEGPLLIQGRASQVAEEREACPRTAWSGGPTTVMHRFRALTEEHAALASGRRAGINEGKAARRGSASSAPRVR